MLLDSDRPQIASRAASDEERKISRARLIATENPHTKTAAEEPRRSHPSVRARKRNRGNPLPTRNAFAGWWGTFRELGGRSADVDGAIADLELAVGTPTADPRGSKQEHRREIRSARGIEHEDDRARIDETGNGITTAVRKSTSGHRRRPVSGDFGQWLRVPQSRAGRGRRGREAGARARGRPRPVTQRFFNPSSLFTFLPSPDPGELADREIDTRDTKFFTLTGRFSRRPRPIFSPGARSVATPTARVRPVAARH